MGRSFTERLNSGKRSQRHRLSTDGARKAPVDQGQGLTFGDPITDLANDTASEVSIDETMTHFSRQPSIAFSDADVTSLNSLNSPPGSRNSILLDRERTINALRHRMEDMQRTISALQNKQDELEQQLQLQAKLPSQDAEQFKEEGKDPGFESPDGQESDVNATITLHSSGGSKSLPETEHAKVAILAEHSEDPKFKPEPEQAKDEASAGKILMSGRPEHVRNEWSPQLLGLAWLSTTASLMAYIWYLKSR